MGLSDIVVYVMSAVCKQACIFCLSQKVYPDPRSMGLENKRGRAYCGRLPFPAGLGTSLHFRSLYFTCG